MSAANPPGPPAYSLTAINPVTNAAIVDANNNITPSIPIFNLQALTIPDSGGNYVPVNTQVLTAILIELKVLSELINQNSANIDLPGLRAELAIGASGGLLT